MREFNLILSRSDKPSYLQIADAIRASIQSGHLKSGESLPSARTLSRSLGKHRHTIMAGLNELIAEGWLISRERQTYQVSHTLPTWFLDSTEQMPRLEKTEKHSWRLVRAAHSRLPAPGAPSAKYAFKSGLADLRLFPLQEFKSYVGNSLRTSQAQNLNYGDPAGHPLLIESLKTYLRRARTISGREIVITHGSQEGIYLAAQLLVKPGDHVAVERLGYQPAWDAIRAAGGKLVTIDIDSEGLDPEHLAQLLKRKRLRLIYTTPLHQYPTTVTLPIARRLRLYELAAKHGVPILEDDYDHEFHYRSQPLAPLASRDPAELVIYVSTFSKVLFPSVRIGFMAVPQSLATALSSYRRIVSRQNETILQDAVAHWMKDGGFERHLRRMRRAYEERRAAIIDCLQTGQDSGLPISWNVPDGGMAIWVDTGTDPVRLAQRLMEKGVFVEAETAYQLKPSRARHLRLGFANQTPKEIQQGIAILLETLKKNKNIS